MISLNNVPIRVEIRICTIDMVLGLKNIGTQNVVLFIHPRDCGAYSALNDFTCPFWAGRPKKQMFV